MQINHNQFISIEQLQDQYLNQNRVSDKSVQHPGVSFQDILSQKTKITQTDISSLRFSKHAANRLSDRNIELTDNQLERLTDGTRKASAKGIQESLVLVDDLAFIVNVPSQTVITAMDQTETNENVFTNIDGAVII